MDKVDKQVLQVVKEIVVKFIETGRVSPTNFTDVFPDVYGTVSRTVRESGRDTEDQGEK